MLRIFNLEGLLIAEIDLIPTLDNAVISPNGFYMMYKSGGSFGNVNQPFARLEKPAWGLVDIQANKVVYHETEKEGTHLDGIFFTQGLLQSNSTTPFDNNHYDYKVFFDESTHTIRNFGNKVNGINLSKNGKQPKIQIGDTILKNMALKKLK